MSKISDNGTRILAEIPETGSIGGVTLQKKTRLSNADYKAALTELLESRRVAIGRGRGGSIRRIDDASDYQVFLSKLDAERPKSNHAIRASLKWDESRYWKVHGELRSQGLIRVGRGRGGTVARVPVQEAAEELDLGPAVPKKMPAAPDRGASESEWYPLLSYVLQNEWDRSKGSRTCWYKSRHVSGRKVTGGVWTRPDITAVSMQRFRLLPERLMEVWTFEVKRPGDWSVVGVHEASAHGRRATRPVLLFVSSTAEHDELSAADQELLDDCTREASRLGVGLMVAYKPYRFEDWDVVVDSERHEPAHELLNGFMESQLSPENQDEIEKWLTLRVHVR